MPWTLLFFVALLLMMPAAAVLALIAVAALLGGSRARRGKRMRCDTCSYSGHPYDVFVHMNDVHGTRK